MKSKLTPFLHHHHHHHYRSADIFNNGWLKCTSETIPVHIDGQGQGYCTPCTPPQTPAPTVRSTPMRKVKKKVVVESKKHSHDDKARGGLFGGMFNNNNKKNKRGDVQGDDAKEAETLVFYDYYRHGEGNAYDRWNGYNSALVDEEDVDDWKTGYGYNSGYGSYGAGGWASKTNKDTYYGRAEAEAEAEGKGKGKDDSYYGKEEDGYYGDEEEEEEGYGYGEESDVYYGAEGGEMDYYYGGEEEEGYGQGYGYGADIYN